MKTEYVQTEFAQITDAIRESFRIRGRAKGVNLIPLAIGEQEPSDEPEQPEPRRIRSWFDSAGAEGDE